jgi:hypothetical protein
LIPYFELIIPTIPDPRISPSPKNIIVKDAVDNYWFKIYYYSIVLSIEYTRNGTKVVSLSYYMFPLENIRRSKKIASLLLSVLI